tara:strand:- start:476 stop:604 length:129 start_codon:yes stop_codon:yes gene_type:complete
MSLQGAVQKLPVEQPMFGKHDHPLDRVFEFPDVPGPRVLNEA